MELIAKKDFFDGVKWVMAGSVFSVPDPRGKQLIESGIAGEYKMPQPTPVSIPAAQQHYNPERDKKTLSVPRSKHRDSNY